jgi:hypothetical protein
VKNRFQSLPFKCNLQRYIADLAASAGVSVSRVVIRRVSSGSVVVDFEILSPGATDGDDAKSLTSVAAEAALGKQLAFTTLQSALNITVGL